MKSKIIAVAMLFCLLAGLITIAVRTSPVYAATELRFNPSTYEEYYTVPDSFFDVFLEIGGVSDLYGFDIKITWDNSLIAYNSETYASYLDTIWGSGTWEVVTHEAGAGYYRYVALGLDPDTTFTGTGTLLKLNFKVLDPLTNSMKVTALAFEIDKLSDKNYQPIAHSTILGTCQIWGKTPTLNLSPTAKTCQMLNEEFDVTVGISDAASVTSFAFTIQYDALLLDCVSVTWNVWGPGAEDHSVDGTVTGSASGSAKDGTQTLLTIRFKATYNHIWKDEATIVPTWHNILTGTIYIQSATLDYTSPQPALTYTKGSASKINVGADFAYTWSPNQGDVDLDGDVDILDVRDVSYFYDQVNNTWNLTGADGKVDIFDLVVVANKFGFDLTP